MQSQPAHAPVVSDPAAPIILASQSPRRRQLLEWAEIPFELVIRPTDESWPTGMPAEDVPVHIARNKALAVQREHPDRVILAADTVVVLGERIIGKPADEQEALDTLRALSGNTHRVITGVVILSGAGEQAFADITRVSFHPMSDEQLLFYIRKYQPYDKAGAYGIQEWIGVTGIQRVEGDFYNVMGLPVSRVVQALATMKR